MALMEGGAGNGQAVQMLMAKVQDSASGVLAERKAWSEMMDKNSFSKPESISEATNRVRKNLTYFKVNYGICLGAIVTVCLLTSPFSLAVVAALAGMWMYLFVVAAGQPLVIGGRQVSDREKLIGASGLTVLVVFFLSSVGSLLIWALGLGVRRRSAARARRGPRTGTQSHTSTTHTDRGCSSPGTVPFAFRTTSSRMTHRVR